MKVVGAVEARNKLGHSLDLAGQGEEVTITRHGKDVRPACARSGEAQAGQATPRSSAYASARRRSSWAASIGPNGRPIATRADRESCFRTKIHCLLVFK